LLAFPIGEILVAKHAMHTKEQISSFLDELKTQTDRGVAIVAAAVLDELLALLIIERLVKLSSDRRDSLFKDRGPFSPFSSKIEVAFALGVISSEARLALHLVRDIRNKFAHRIEALRFDDPAISQMIASRGTDNVKKLKGSTREKFVTVFQAMAGVLYGTLAAPNLRIKSLEETHADYFLRMMMEAIQGQQAHQAASQKGSG
jgi:DNA-binding MltR family transcriptional regulator